MSEKTELFLDLLIPNQKRLLNYILTMVPNRTDADDIMQNVIKLLWQKFDSYEPGTDFTAWAVSFARFEILNHRRNYSRQRSYFQEETMRLLQQQTPGTISEADPKLEALKECIRKLPGRDMDLVHLRYQREIAVKTISKRFGVTVQSIYKRIGRIHDILIRCVRRKLVLDDSR